MPTLQKGDTVAWKWASGVAEGTVEAVCPERTEITTKGKTIHRNGTKDDPAVIIVQQNGTKVLKLAHELTITT
jgi:hypothetical protein